MSQSVLDLQLITANLLDLVTSSMGGAEVQHEEFDVKLKLPIQIVNIFKHISATQGVPIDELVSKAANTSVTDYVRSLVKPETPQPTNNSQVLELEQKFSSISKALESVGNLTSTLGQLQTKMSELKELEKNEK